MGIHFFFKAQISEFKIRFCSQKAQDSILATSLHTSYIILGKLLVSALLTMPKPLTVWITTNCGEFLRRWEYQTVHFTCLLRNLYAGQEARVSTGHGTTDLFQIGKGVCQGCILSPCLFNLYAEYIM